MAEDTEPLLDATTALIPPLLGALETLAVAGRHLDPQDLPAVVARAMPAREPLAAGLQAFEAVTWPPHLADFRQAATAAAGQALEGLDALAGCLDQSNPIFGAYRAMGFATRANAALYPVAFMLPPVNRYFLCDPERQDEARQAALLRADPNRDGVGVMHARNETDTRGGFSLYVPEDVEVGPSAGEPSPLIVALHGGSGHGRRFLWTWLREARSRGALVLSPTACGDTWSLMDPAVDGENLLAMVAHVCSVWNVDPHRVLLTGMSDGGTFSYLAGLRDGVPFTHLAPISATFHPMLLDGASEARLRGLPVYLVHGVLDWMFPVDVARMARDALTAAGARVTYRELDDLSHTYPREENVRILDWMLGEPADPPA